MSTTDDRTTRRERDDPTEPRGARDKEGSRLERAPVRPQHSREVVRVPTERMRAGAQRVRAGRRSTFRDQAREAGTELDLDDETFSTGPLPRQAAAARHSNPFDVVASTGELDLDDLDQEELPGDIGEADIFDDMEDEEGAAADSVDELPAAPRLGNAVRAAPRLDDPGELDLDEESGPVSVDELAQLEALAGGSGSRRDLAHEEEHEDDAVFEFTPAAAPAGPAPSPRRPRPRDPDLEMGDLVDQLAALLEAAPRTDAALQPSEPVALPPPEPVDLPPPEPIAPVAPPLASIPTEPEPSAAAAPEVATGPLIPIASAAEQAMDMAIQGTEIEVDSGLELAMKPTPSVGIDLSGTLYEGPEVDDAAQAVAAAASQAVRLSSGAALPLADMLEDQHSEVSEVALDAARAACRELDKAVKIVDLYEGRGEASTKGIEAAHAALVTALAHGALDMRVTPFELLLDERVVYYSERADSALTYRLFDDGVRELTLLPGLTVEELRSLVEVLRPSRARDAEHDSVTRLWELALPSVQYRAVEGLFEGLAVDLAAPGSIDVLVAEASRPLHGQHAVGSPAPALDAASGGPQIPGELLAIDPAHAIAQVREAAAGFADDVWRRAIAVYAQLLSQQDEGGPLAAQVAPLVEHLFDVHAFDTLAAIARAIAAVAEKAELADGAQPLADTLRHLCLQGRFVELESVVAEMSASDFEPLAQLFEHLPQEADRQLLQLLNVAPAGPVRDRLRGVIGKRGVDLSDYYVKRLTSKNIADAVGAVRALRGVGGDVALQALRGALAHKSAQVPYEAACALRELAGVDLAPDLIATLPASTRQLRAVVLEMLEGYDPVAARPVAPALLDVLGDERVASWPRSDRQRLLRVVVRWGGEDVNEHVLRTISQSNTFRRKRIEEERQDMFEAVQRVGGKRAERLLRACLSRKPPDAVRAGIDTALRRMDPQTGDSPEPSEDDA
ncbi:MAG: hypothetical protein KC503_34930 [Myxococcales bacterium]|nr:hypothetical protein [Myxococcales bacterium]